MNMNTEKQHSDRRIIGTALFCIGVILGNFIIRFMNISASGADKTMQISLTIVLTCFVLPCIYGVCRYLIYKNLLKTVAVSLVGASVTAIIAI